MHTQSLSQLSRQLKEKTLSSRELVDHYIERIERLNPQLNAFISVFAEKGRQAAEKADQLRAQGESSPLLGLPIAHKDLFCTEDERTTCASKMLEHFISPYESTVTERLKEAGMVSLGKTNMDEFAMGATTETSFFGATHNPWDLKRSPGGSSGGSAAAVAARLIPASTASDTSGSIRQPASFCGVTGIKPTYGRVSRWGMVAYASSLDQAGLLASSAEDCALLLESMAGFDPLDSTSVETAVPNYSTHLNDEITGLKIGLPDDYFESELSGEVRELFSAAIKSLETEFKVEFVPIKLPHTELAAPAYYVIGPAEGSSNLARFDGVRFGHRCDSPVDLIDMYERSRQEGLGSEVKRRILLGTHLLSNENYETYYLQAQKVRRLICDDFRAAFEKVDLILTPVTPSTASLLGEKEDDPLNACRKDIFTIPASLAGLPAMALPTGFASGLPVGMQLIGQHFDEQKLLNVAHLYQSATSWHQMIPEGFEV
jgi:aspartyl-tRNA(Asn)/glutamyl-tRNA(Gln) amidotransferase subunit A